MNLCAECLGKARGIKEEVAGQFLLALLAMILATLSGLCFAENERSKTIYGLFLLAMGWTALYAGVLR